MGISRQQCDGDCVIICLLMVTQSFVIRAKIRKELLMASALIQFRTEDTAKIKAINVCEKLGIDLPTYMRMCISRLIQENGIPFSMKLDTVPENKGIKAMKAASVIAIENSIAEMTLDEINAEIAEARK